MMSGSVTETDVIIIGGGPTGYGKRLCNAVGYVASC